MKRCLNAILCILLLSLTLNFLLPMCQATDTAQTTGGTLGDNITWVFDYNTNELTISGTGAIPRSYETIFMEENLFQWNYSVSHWYSLPVYKVVIKEGITSIGAYAFCRLRSLSQVYLPNGLISIGDDAFSFTQIRDIVFPESLRSIEGMAFWDTTALRSANFKGDMPEIAYDAFYYRSQSAPNFGEDPIPGLTIFAPSGNTTWDASRLYGVPLGYWKPKYVDPVPPVYHTLNLQSDISVNYYIKRSFLTDFIASSIYLECTMDLYENGEIVGTTSHKLLPKARGDYYVFTLDHLNATRINDTITAVLHGLAHKQTYQSQPHTYKIATYAYNQLNKDVASDDLKTLCANLLRYGSSAQTYKNYRTDALADGSMTAVHRTYLTDLSSVVFGNTDTVASDLPDASITWAGKSLILDTRITVKFIFDVSNYSGTPEDLSLRITYTDRHGETRSAILAEPQVYNESLNYYAFAFDGLDAGELRTVLNVQIYAGDTPLSATLSYSPDTYGRDEAGSLSALCKAILAYSDSVKTYFN